MAAWEGAWWLRRRALRKSTYAAALKRAAELDRILVVVGAPDGGVTAGYGCGDYVVDINGSRVCRRVMPLDVTRRTTFDDDSVVVFVSCVLEYVSDYDAALRELCRISGGELYAVRVEPWTLTAYLYPGAQRRIPVLRPGACRRAQ